MTFAAIRRRRSVSDKRIDRHFPTHSLCLGNSSADLLDLMQEQSRLLQLQSVKLDSFHSLLLCLLRRLEGSEEGHQQERRGG
jgi:hypothetical protein